MLLYESEEDNTLSMANKSSEWGDEPVLPWPMEIVTVLMCAVKAELMGQATRSPSLQSGNNQASFGDVNRNGFGGCGPEKRSATHSEEERLGVDFDRTLPRTLCGTQKPRRLQRDKRQQYIIHRKCQARKEKLSPFNIYKVYVKDTFWPVNGRVSFFGRSNRNPPCMTTKTVVSTPSERG